MLGVACTSAEALELVAELRPDVVLVDMALGDECGLDLAQRLTGDGRGDAPLIILISAYSPADIAELVKASPVAGFLQKSDLSSDAIRQIVMSSGRDSARGQLAGQDLLSTGCASSTAPASVTPRHGPIVSSNDERRLARTARIER